MQSSKTKTIPFKGIYWWGDAENVIKVLEKELKQILGDTQIHSIKITGNDFNDGKENRSVEITVDTLNNKIIVTKICS